MADPLPKTSVSLAEQLSSLVGARHVRPARAEEAIRGTAARWVIEPGSEQEVASVLRFANQTGLSVIPRGGGTKQSWGNPPQRADVILSLLRLNQVVEHAWADLTVTAEAGCTFAELQSALANRGQRLALDPLWPERATIGGILSANDTGALRLCYGGLRDLVIGATLALADGTLARSGGKVVKNVAGYDLCKLATGAMGTLGVLTRAVLRVHPIPGGTRTLTVQGGSLDATHRLLLGLLNSNLKPACIQVRMAVDSPIAVDLGLEGNNAGLAAQEAAIQTFTHSLNVVAGSPSIWAAREDLCAPSSTTTVAKITTIPSSITSALTSVGRLTGTRGAHWRAAIQATGIGWWRLEADARSVSGLIEDLRAEMETGGGTLVVLQIPPTAATTDAWGHVGDALPLMIEVKRQFDPRRTLNPGRFVGGI